MIFESVYNLLHKIKHDTNFAQKEKGKKHYAASGPGTWPAGRPVLARPTRALRALLPSSLCGSLTGGSRTSDLSSSSRRGSGEPKHAVGELPASAIRQASTLSPLRISCGARTTCYPPQSPLLASTADGGTNRASTGRHKLLKREPTSA